MNAQHSVCVYLVTHVVVALSHVQYTHKHKHMHTYMYSDRMHNFKYVPVLSFTN